MNEHPGGGGMVMLDVAGRCWKWEGCVAFICFGQPIKYVLIDCIGEYDRLWLCVTLCLQR
jgi:hypothetical protein